MFSCSLIGVSHVSTCVHCLLAYCCGSPREVWLRLLCVFQSGTCRQQLGLPWAFSSSHWTQLCVPQLPGQLGGICWTCSSTSLSFLYWTGQNWTQYSRYGLTSAKWRGRTTSLALLATLLVMQPRTWLAAFDARAHCWSMSNLLSTMHPGVLSWRAAGWAQPVQWHWVILSQMQYFVFTFDEIHEVPICSFLQPVQVLLISIPTHQCYKHFLQFGVIPKLAKSALYPVVFCPQFSSAYGNPPRRYLV